MPIKVHFLHLGVLGLQDNAITYNPNRTKLLLTTTYFLSDGQGWLHLYIPPYAAGERQFPLWGNLRSAVATATSPNYLMLTGQMAVGPWGLYNPGGAGYTVYWIEEIESEIGEEVQEAPGMVEPEEKEEKKRSWWLFKW